MEVDRRNHEFAPGLPPGWGHEGIGEHTSKWRGAQAPVAETCVSRLIGISVTTLEATQAQIDGFFSELPYK